MLQPGAFLAGAVFSHQKVTKYINTMLYDYCFGVLQRQFWTGMVYIDHVDEKASMAQIGLIFRG